DASRRRYLARAAFRCTPHGLWAGVGVGRVADKTVVASGQALAAHEAPRWADLAALGRSLLDEPARREKVRLRRTPSLLWRHDRLTWLAAGEVAAEQKHAEADLLLEAVLDACDDWCAWADVRAVARHV